MNDKIRVWYLIEDDTCFGVILSEDLAHEIAQDYDFEVEEDSVLKSELFN